MSRAAAAQTAAKSRAQDTRVVTGIERVSGMEQVYGIGRVFMTSFRAEEGRRLSHRRPDPRSGREQPYVRRLYTHRHGTADCKKLGACLVNLVGNHPMGADPDMVAREFA